jgi:putative transposase
LKLNPNKEQKLVLAKWAGCTRFLFNKTIAHLTDPNFNKKNIFNIKARLAVVKNNNFYNNKEWLQECPSAIRKSAIFEAHSNLKACFSNYKAGNIKKFKPPFRTKKDEKQNGWSLGLERLNLQKQKDHLYIFKNILGEMRYYGTKQLHKLMPDIHPEMDCKLQKDRYGDYYLIIPYKVIKKPIPKEFINPVSLDPGIRKFITSYAPNSQESFVFGNRWGSIIMEKLISLDKMYSKINKKRKLVRIDKKLQKVKKIKIQKIKKIDFQARKETQKTKKHEIKVTKPKIVKLRKKIDNLKIELRNQVANFLSKRYDLILLPKLDVKNLTKKKHRKLKTKTSRMLLNARHSSFFNHLKDKCFEHGTKFLHVREEYTSQTCPCCGQLSKCNELYKCKYCGFVHDRDIVGALNIMLKSVR